MNPVHTHPSPMERYAEWLRALHPQAGMQIVLVGLSKPSLILLEAPGPSGAG